MWLSLAHLPSKLVQNCTGLYMCSQPAGYFRSILSVLLNWLMQVLKFASSSFFFFGGCDQSRAVKGLNSGLFDWICSWLGWSLENFYFPCVKPPWLIDCPISIWNWTQQGRFKWNTEENRRMLEEICWFLTKIMSISKELLKVLLRDGESPQKPEWIGKRSREIGKEIVRSHVRLSGEIQTRTGIREVTRPSRPQMVHEWWSWLGV